MITVGMNYEVIEGKEEVFERAFRSVIEALNTAPGHTVSHLYKDIDSLRSYLIISEWDDQEAFQSFIQSDQFRRVANWGKEQILAGRPRHRIYNEES